MTDCFHLLGQLSGLASREKNHHFFLFFQLYCTAADRNGPSKPYMWNQNSHQIGRRLSSDSIGRLHKQDVEGNQSVGFFTGFQDAQLAHWTHILSNTLAKSTPRCNISGFIEITWDNTGRAGRGCILCLFAGWSAPAQPVSPFLGKAAVSGRSIKPGPRLQTMTWGIKELAEYKQEAC